MKRGISLFSTWLLILTACDHLDNSPNKGQSSMMAEDEDVDNSGRNVRDRDMNSLTPGDQLENETDRRITKESRRALVADDSLSTNAKNIKIITIDGVVTLRGVVESNQEKSAIEKKINTIQGINRIDNLLEVKGKK